MYYKAGLLLITLIGVNNLNAANRYSIANGNWNLTSSWAATSGGAAGASIPVAADNVFIESNKTVTIASNTACTNISIANGSTLNVGAFNLTTTGLVSVSGAINFTRIVGAKTFTGLVTVNSSGIWNNTINSPIFFGGGITNSGTFDAGTGTYTFNTKAQVLTGTLSIPNVTATIQLTNNGTLTAGTSLTGSGNLIQGLGTSVLNIGGISNITTLTATTTGNTVNYTGGAQTVKNTAAYSNLTLSGSGAKILSTGTTTINGNFTMAGTATTTGVAGLTINGDVTLGSGTAFTGGAFIHTISGNWINNGGIFTPGTGTITMNGTTAKTIGGTSSTTFNNLIINNSGGVSLTNSQIVNGSLTLTNGRLTLGAHNLTLGASAVAGTLSVNNMILTDGTGELRRNITANGSYIFPVGEVTGTAEYSPITINFSSGTYGAGAYASARVINAKHPDNSGTSNYLNRYWTVNQSGITAFSATVIGTFQPADVVGNIGSIFTGKWNGALPWQVFGAVSATTITASGLADLGDFTGIDHSSVEIWNGTLQAGFQTLKGAFDAINKGTYSGALEIKIVDNTTETASAVLFQSGYTGAGGTSNYSSVSIYPTSPGLTVTGNVAAPLIDLNGADHVTIDGSVNALGSTKSLTLTNTNASNTLGTSTIRLINSAESNTVKYCIIKGSETNATSGVVFFSTAAAGNGNDGNTIDNNDITSATTRPLNAIYSAGSTSFENSSNTILYNDIFNCWNASASSSAILIGSNSSDFTISKNSFFETTAFVPTENLNYQMVRINNPSGNNFTISNNYLGGQAPLCAGSPMQLGSSVNVHSIMFDPIQIAAGTTTSSSIQENRVKNISIFSSNAEPFRAIKAEAGSLNIGTITGNSIGSDTDNGSITVTGTISGGNVYGIYISSPGAVDCQNNNIGSITTKNSNSENATNLYGIYKTAAAGTTTISKNIIGNMTIANSLNASSVATGNPQLLFGIYSAGTGSTTISENTIANITNGTTETGSTSSVRGILTTNGSNSIENNEVHHLKSGGAASGNNYENTSLIGISQLSAAAGTTQNISGNSVYNLTNTATVKMEMYGIFYWGPQAGTNTISRNFVHSFFINSTDQAYLHGISLYDGAFTASNNIVFVGNTISTGCSMWAMWTNSNDAIKLYHNTLYLSGVAATGSSNTYAFRSLNANPTSAVIKNNILWNGRTNSNNVISHFAIYLQSAANTSVDYNDYKFAQEFGIVGANSYANFVAWKSGTGFDANSLELDPQLENLGGILPIDYQTRIGLPGTSGTGISTDYNEIERSTTAPTMGAWEYFSNPVEIWNGSTFRAGYTTLKGAFDKINDGTWKGDLIIKFRGNTTETASAVINASGTGPSSYTSILIYPARLGVMVTGSLAAPLVDLNGGDHITIDGRKDATGTVREMTFSNTNTSNTAGTSTFRLINDATNNTIKYCNIKGASTDPNGGILFLSTTTGTTGNDGNMIDNNSITNSADANRPLNAYYSAGTTGLENSGNTISNNSFFNFLNKGKASNGIYLGNNTTDEIIRGNSFYETGSFITSASVAYNIINIRNPSGVNYSVTGNFIGGSSALCAGAAWTKTAFDNAFMAINLNAGTGTASNVQNNTIKNMAWSNAGAASWTAINIAAGTVNIGTSTGNIVGATIGTGSITVTGGATATNVYGINIGSSGNIDCQNNVIGSFTVANSSTNATNFYGVFKSATSGTTTISNNVIGSITTANSINDSSVSSANAQSVFGIYNAGTGSITISGNTIANLKNGTTNATSATTGLINGIISTGGTNSVTNNTISSLTIANGNTATNSNASVIGIALTGSTGIRTITGNTISGLSNTFATFAGRVIGLYYEGSTTGTNEVSKNFIHSLSTTGTAGASLLGIQIVSGNTTYSNNIINLGSANQNVIYGVYDSGAASQTCNFYFNTVYIGGVVSGGANNSYAFYSAASSDARNLRNNILHNTRSRTAGTSSHYAIYFAAIGGSLVSNYNDYITSGTGSVLGYYGGNLTTLQALKAATSQDANSIISDPKFIIPGSTVAANYKIGVSLSGGSGTGITIDYGSGSRGAVPTMGAWEGNINKWKGTTSTDWNTAANWTGNTIPAADANIVFDANPVNHCVLDQDRSVTDIINAQKIYRMIISGHKLTVKGDFLFTNNAQIDASLASSNVVLAGTSAQIIPAGTFYNSEVYDLTVNNVNNVTLFGTLRLLHSITANSGRLEATDNTPTVVYAGSTSQTIESNRYLNDMAYNLSIDNVSGVMIGSNAAIVVPHDLTITKGVLTVPPGSLLTADNYIKLDYRAPLPVPNPKQIDYWSCLVLKSNATSTGSFIHSDLFTGIGTVKVERFMSKTDNWHLYSSPIKDQSVKDFLKYNPEIPDLYNTTVTPNVIIGVGMRNYITTTNVWGPNFVYAATSTTPGSIGGGKGFSIRTFNDALGTGTVDATGIPNPNTVNVTLTRSTATTDQGWNCIGNPFTSALNIRNVNNDGFLNASNSNALETGYEAVYVWDTNNITTNKTTPEYIVINNATSITSVQTGQGFFVKSAIGGGKISFTKVMQKPSAVLTFKDAAIEWPSIRIVANKQTISSSTEIKLVANTTKGLDPGYDAGMLKANLNFALYTKLLEGSDVDFTLQCLPDQNIDQYVIPLGLDSKEGGDITFTAETVNLPSGCQVLLEDRTAKRFTRLDQKDASYTANVSADTKGTGRFFLHTSDVISGDQSLENQPYNVSSIGKLIYINGEVSDKAMFCLYSVNGKLLANFKAENQVQNHLDASGFPSGVYILTVVDKNQKKSVKFLLEK